VRRAAIGSAMALVVAGGIFGVARAQSVDTKRPHTLIVGAPAAVTPMDRSNAARTGFSRARLPTKNIKVEWKRSLNTPLEFSPLVDDAGGVLVVTEKGDVVQLRPDGTEASRVPTGALHGGPPTLTSDGTVVFVGQSGEAIGVRRAAVRFRTRVAPVATVATEVAPLPLDDGGTIVATRRELFALDSDGTVRMEADAPEVIASPLVSAQGKVIFVSASGAVYGWTPGRDISKIGSFGASLDGAAALADDHTLVAVLADGESLVAFDLVRGLAATRATPPSGVYLGPPAMHGPTAFLFGMTPAKTSVFALDSAGKEAWHLSVENNPITLSPDGGAAPLVVPPHAGTLVDAANVVAFGSPYGAVGVVAGSAGTAEVLGDPLCAQHGSSDATFRTVVGLASSGPGAFLVACASGAVAKVTGDVADVTQPAGEAGATSL
jgi:outer membrane protein assembly factor BamB